MYLAVAECTDRAVDRVGGGPRGENSNGRFLYGQCGSIRIDKHEGPVHWGGVGWRECMCVGRAGGD